MVVQRQYIVTANDSWENITEIIRTTKYALVRSWKLDPSYGDDIRSLSQDRISHARFPIPEEGELFKHFRTRLRCWNMGESSLGIVSGYILGNIAGLRHGSRAVASVSAGEGYKDCMLSVKYCAVPDTVDIRIQASGSYMRRGNSIAGEVRAFLTNNNVMHHYESI